MYDALARSGIITLRFDKDKNGHDIMVTNRPELEADDILLLGYAKEGLSKPKGNRWSGHGLFGDDDTASVATGWYEGRINDV